MEKTLEKKLDKIEVEVKENRKENNVYESFNMITNRLQLTELHIEHHKTKIEHLEKSVDSIEKSIDSINQKHNETHSIVSKIETKVDGIFETVQTKMTQFMNNHRNDGTKVIMSLVGIMFAGALTIGGIMWGISQHANKVLLKAQEVQIENLIKGRTK